MKTGFLTTLALAGLFAAAPLQSRGNGPGIAFTGRASGTGGHGEAVGGGGRSGGATTFNPANSFGGYGGYSGYDPYGYDYPSTNYNYPVTGESDLDTSNYDGTTWLGVEVQRALAREGYYDGPLDGVVGTGMHVAISQFQHDNDLPITGTINGRLLRALGLKE
jgi:peptidoglycan hydrolase-like protein with peptidoglycan-binding domain